MQTLEQVHYIVRNLVEFVARYREIFSDVESKKIYHESDYKLAITDLEKELLVDVLGFVGREVKIVKPKWSDQGGLAIPHLFTAIDADNRRDWHNEIWLHNVLMYILKNQKILSFQALCEKIALGLEESILLKPVQLTSHKDLLKESGNETGFLNNEKHLGEEDILSYSENHRNIGIHRFCGGHFERHRTSELLDVLSCRECFLRVYFPKEIETFRDLRSYFISLK